MGASGDANANIQRQKLHQACSRSCQRSGQLPPSELPAWQPCSRHSLAPSANISAMLPCSLKCHLHIDPFPSEISLFYSLILGMQLTVASFRKMCLASFKYLLFSVIFQSFPSENKQTSKPKPRKTRGEWQWLKSIRNYARILAVTEVSRNDQKGAIMDESIFTTNFNFVRASGTCSCSPN